MTDSPRVLANRYEVGDLLGRGGMAEVHIGRDTRLGRVVAIKLLRTDLARDPVFQARFRREAQSAAALNHPAIVAVYDTGEEQVMDAGGGIVGLPYIVMEYVEGRTLRDLLRGGRPIEIGLALEVTSGVLSALDYSHRAGIVHRDIKPANVMLTPNGDVKVMDFGIARALADASATMTQTQAVIGTAQYLSPEQARGETVDARSDLYSTGCLLFELVTGRPPFVADSPVAVAYQHVREAPPLPSDLNPTIPPDLDRVIMHSLSKDRQTRYQTAGEFRADVDNLLTGRAVLAPAHDAFDAQRGATTEFYGAAATGTRAMAPPATGYGQSVLPGGPGEDDLPYRSRRDAAADRGGRGWRYVLIGLAVVLIFGGGTYALMKVFGGSPPDRVTITPVKGLPQAEATAKLTQQGLKVAVDPKVDEATPVGNVIGTDPAEGTAVAPGSTVTIIVSSGPDQVAVPDVSKSNQQQARSAIEAAGLTVGDVQNVDDQPEFPKGTVVRTDPEAGATAKKGSKVTVFLSTGQVTIKNYKGLTFDEAAAQLGAIKITVLQRTRESDQAPGTVLAQSLSPNTKVATGERITLTVAVARPTQPPTQPPTSPPATSPSVPPATQPSLPTESPA